MPCWYYDKKDLKNTPSLQDGIDFETEYRYRKEGARFIIDTGTKMGLRYDTMASGVVYFHRFYMFHSFKEFPRYVTACCCLFLAGKVEETPKKCKDIIKVAKASLSEAQFQQFGNDAKVTFCLQCQKNISNTPVNNSTLGRSYDSRKNFTSDYSL